MIFTSGGTESNNHALKGIFFANNDRGDHMVTIAVEHPAVLQPLRFLERLGAKVTIVPVDRAGRVDPDDVRKAHTPRTLLVSVMHSRWRPPRCSPWGQALGRDPSRASRTFRTRWRLVPTTREGRALESFRSTQLHRERIETGRLVELRVQGMDVRRSLFAVYHRDKR